MLDTGEFRDTVQLDKDLPEHLCGGTYRSRGRKRKQKKQLSYQEKKERRILNKFGANGVALGEDEIIKTELEKGKKVQGKPRVAASKRGRELRAAAALARFDQQKKSGDEDKKIKGEDDDETQSGTESETASDNEGEAAVDINGKRLVDKKGHNFVKVCEDENVKDEDVQNEMKELFQSTIKWKPEKPEKRTSSSSSSIGAKAQELGSLDQRDERDEKSGTKRSPSQEANMEPILIDDDGEAPDSKPGVCVMCSFASGPKATICDVCSHVLDPRKVPGSWKCKSSSCRESLYLNAGDSGGCGVCGQRKGV